MRYYEYMVTKGKKDMSKYKVGDKVVRVKPSNYPKSFGHCDKVYEVLDVNSTGDIEVIEGKPKALASAFVSYEEYRESSYKDYNNVSRPTHYNQGVDNGEGINSDGGPSAYYDFHNGWCTWNDFADYKATQQWKEHSFHLGNVGKVLCRWGDKSGTSKSYDARKIVYSGLRVLLMLEDKENVRAYLENMLKDNQFKDCS